MRSSDSVSVIDFENDGFKEAGVLLHLTVESGGFHWSGEGDSFKSDERRRRRSVDGFATGMEEESVRTMSERLIGIMVD